MVFELSAVLTLSVARTIGGGGGSVHLSTVHTEMDSAAAAEHVSSTLHHESGGVFKVYLAMFNQQGPLILWSSRKVSSEFVAVPKMCAMLLYFVLLLGAGLAPS